MARGDGEAGQRYAEGLERQRRGDLAGATRCFFQAIAGDPLLFDAGAALARAIATELAVGRAPAPTIQPLRAALPTFSVIICSNRAALFERVVGRYRRLLHGTRHEIIGIHDARSMCEGYNRAVRASRGEVLLLSHDDVDVLAPDFVARLARALRQFDVVGVAGATKLTGPAWGCAGHPHVHGWIAHRPGGAGPWCPSFWSVWPQVERGVVLDGALIAARRDVVESVRFDDESFDGFHCYDVDFSWRASRAGYRVGICGELGLVHESLGRFDEAWRRSAHRFSAKFPECSGEMRPSHRYEVALAAPALAYAFFRRLEALALELRTTS